MGHGVIGLEIQQVSRMGYPPNETSVRVILGARAGSSTTDIYARTKTYTLYLGDN